MRPFEQIPLVGPGSELQLTLDGRAVPHADVVGAQVGTATPPDPVRVGAADDRRVPDGQTSL